MFRVGIGEYEVSCQADGLPTMLSNYQQHAVLSEEFTVADEVGSAICFVCVGKGPNWPFLVVVQRYAPAGFGFIPGILLVPETNRLFVGAGCRLLLYDLLEPRLLWEDNADCGFWSWSKHGSVVLMAAELEMAAWDTQGRKLWSKFVEPPWHFSVAGEVITIDVMGSISRIHLVSGEPAEVVAAEHNG